MIIHSVLVAPRSTPWSKANKREGRQRLVERALGVSEPMRTADGLMLLVEGAYAISPTLGGPNEPAKESVSAAEALIRAEVS
jgi:hypothetical protein